jgi:hypothetical protein
MLIVVLGGLCDLPLLGAGVPFCLPFMLYPLFMAVLGLWLVRLV